MSTQRAEGTAVTSEVSVCVCVHGDVQSCVCTHVGVFPAVVT